MLNRAMIFFFSTMLCQLIIIIWQRLIVFLRKLADTKHLYNICTMLDQRRRRWANIVQMLYNFFVFAGSLRVLGSIVCPICKRKWGHSVSLERRVLIG